VWGIVGYQSVSQLQLPSADGLKYSAGCFEYMAVDFRHKAPLRV
jgi:hypothetical protein